MAKQPSDVKGHVLFEIFTKAIYTTFTRAIKEAVSNAYDAGANNVEIVFDPPTFVKDQVAAELTIQIWDDGIGMSVDDFWEKFASIDSEKHPWEKNTTTGRYPIGKFGIGSFALIPFSLEMTIYSKKYGEKPIKCVIHSTKLLKKSPDRFPEHLSKNIEAAVIADPECAAYRDALALFKQLAADLPNQPNLRNSLASTFGNLARLCHQRQDFQAAKDYLDEAQPHLQAALKANPRQPWPCWTTSALRRRGGCSNN
jgi:hypothetical protein